MKQFYFNVNATIYQCEDYNNAVNHWPVKAVIKAETLDQAIKELFKSKLHFTYKKKYAHVRNCIDNGSINILEYSILVDKDNVEILGGSRQYKEWKAGKIILFACDLLIEIFEIVNLTLLIK
jgi:hypothetical protein